MGVLVTIATGALVTTTEAAAVDEVTAVAVGFPPLRQLQALEIFSGTLAQRAAYAGSVWVGALVYAEQNGFAAMANNSNSSRQAS